MKKLNPYVIGACLFLVLLFTSLTAAFMQAHQDAVIIRNGGPAADALKAEIARGEGKRPPPLLLIKCAVPFVLLLAGAAAWPANPRPASS